MAAVVNRTSRQGNGGANLTSTLTLDKPSGTLDGHFIIVVLEVGFGTNGLSLTGAPGGWTQLFQSGPIANTTGYGYMWVYVKPASSEPASWTWTMNSQVAFYNCHAITMSDVNAVQPYEQLGTQSSAGLANGGQLSDSATTTVTSETIVSILGSVTATGSSSWAENVGTENFESLFGGCDVALNLADMPTPGTQSVTGTLTSGANAAAFMVQFALLPAIIVVGRSVAQPYTLKGLAGKSLVLTYTQIGVVGRSLALPYIARVFLPTSLALPFRVLVPTGRSLAVLYPIRVEVGHSLVLPYGLAVAVPIPGKSGIDTYGDGASSPFGLAFNEASDLSIFATFVSIPWYPPEGLEEMEYARLPLFGAQEVFELSPIDTKTVRRARAGWHGRKFDRERGSFAIVASEGPLADLVGERLRVTFSELVRSRSIFVYVHDEADLADGADISLPRRIFLTLDLLYKTTVDVNIEVAG